MIRKKTSSCLEDEGILLLHIVPTVSPSPHRHFCLHCCRNAVGHFSRALPFPPPPPLHFKDAARRLSSQTVCQRAPLCHPAALITHSLGESPNHLCCYRSGAEGSAQMGAAVICPRPPQSSHITQVLSTSAQHSESTDETLCIPGSVLKLVLSFLSHQPKIYSRW